MFGLFLMTFASVAGASFIMDEMEDEEEVNEAAQTDFPDHESGAAPDILTQISSADEIGVERIDPGQLDMLDESDIASTLPEDEESETQQFGRGGLGVTGAIGGLVDTVTPIVGGLLSVEGGEADDSGHAEYVTGGLSYVSDELDDLGGGLLDLVLGDEDNEVAITGGVVDIVSGAGHDVIDADGMEGGRIVAGSGDLVLGSNAHGDPHDVFPDAKVGIELHDDAEFRGGTAGEYVVAFGDGAVIDAGHGNDTILAFDGSSTIDGGAGDDFIDAHAKDSEYNQMTRYSDKSGDGFADVVDGGAGNDTIFVDGGDTVTGGGGNDTIRVSYDLGSGSDPVVIEDYKPDEDTVSFIVDNYEPVTDPAGGESYDPTDRVEIVQQGEHSHLLVDNELVAILKKTEALEVDATHVPDEGYGGWYGLKLSISGPVAAA